MIGTTIHNRYRLEAELGRGGVGVVYRGHDELLNRPVAVKVLSDGGSGTVGSGHLLQEAQAVARLNHPNIVGVYDAGEAGGVPFIVMELVEGETLRVNAPQEIGTILAIAMQVCVALEHAHNQALIHRDLKPENIVLTTRTQTVKLMDFGLARRANTPQLTSETGALIGTFSYLAPELVMGEPASVQSDLYAFGVMLYEWVAGQPPFLGDNLMAVLSQHLYAPVVPPSTYRPEVPLALDELILSLLQKDVSQRPASAEAVRQQLEQIISPETAVAPAGLESVPDSLLGRLVRGRLVGREREFDEAKQLWRLALSGENQILLVSGEPGIGKTRLVKELIALAELSRGAILLGECYAEGGAPYAPITQAVRAVFNDPHLKKKSLNLPPSVLAELIQLAPDLSQLFPLVPPNPPLEPQAEQQRLFESVVTLLTAVHTQAPVLLVVDDAHWADSGTLFLVRHLLRRVRGSKLRLLVVLTYREIELGETRALNDLLIDLQRERQAVRVKLTRLTMHQTHNLLEAMFTHEVTEEFAAGVFRETEGNPFFVEEVCKALIEEGKLYRENGRWQRTGMAEIHMPQSVKVTIQSRITKLPTIAQDVLRLAAIIGREFDFSVLQKAGEWDEDSLIEALETAEKAQLISELKSRGPEAFVFAHALIPAALQESVSSLRRNRLHRRVANALEAVRPTDYETLAFHYGETGDEERARHYYKLAADRALAAFANQDAEKYYRAVLDLSAEGMEAAEARANLGQSLHRQSRYAEASEVWQLAIGYYEQDTVGDKAGWLYAQLARAVSHGGDMPGSLMWCLKGVKLLADRPESPGKAALLQEAARSSYFNGDAVNGRLMAEQALAMAQKLGVVQVECEALATLGVLPSTSYDEGLRLLEKAAVLAEKKGFLATAVRAYNNLGSQLAGGGQFVAARDYFFHAGEMSRRRGSASEELFVLTQAIDCSLSIGDFTTVEEQLPHLEYLQGQAVGLAAGAFSLWGTQASVKRYRGEWQEAKKQFVAFIAEAQRRGDIQQWLSGCVSLGELLFELGELSEAETVLREGIAISSHFSQGKMVRCILVLVLVRLGRHDEAKTLLAQIQAMTAEELITDKAYVLLAEGAVAPGDAGIEKVATAVKLFAQLDMRWYNARILQELANAYLQRNAPGDRALAQTSLTQARDLFAQMNIPKYVQLVETQLEILLSVTKT